MDIVRDDTTFSVIFAVIAVLVVIVFVAAIVLAVRNARAYRKKGLDPTTSHADLAARVMHSEALSPRRPLEERLAELDRLRDAGTITAEEHAAARARILGEA